MKTRVIFFDDEPQTSQRLKALLQKHGYDVSSPETIEEAFEEINQNGAELIVHSAHKSKTHWNVCDAIFNEYPQFPSIHFATGPSAEIHHINMKGPFHHKLRPLIPEREFLKRVRKLVFLGRLHRENSTLRKVLRLRNQIDRLFDSLDTSDLKTKIVEFFASEFKASNAYFLAPGGYGFYLQEAWKVASINNVVDHNTQHKHDLICATPSTQSDLSSLINEMSPDLPKSWEFRETRTLIKSGKRQRQVCVVPLIGPKNNHILGHVLIVEPLLFGEIPLEKVYPHLTRVLGRHLEQLLTLSEAKSLNYIDDLTDLYNQRYLKLVLDKEISRAKRSGSAFSVLFMDIDHFKQVNDTKGHIIGSKVLVELSKILHENIRTVDYGFRYGGDEFLLILVDTDSKNALTVAERIRKQVEASTFQVDDANIRVTLSIGIATFPEHAMTKEQIIELADRAMYCGKNKSRNVVYVAS